MTVRLLTESQKNQLFGQLYDENSYFNPTQDLYNRWFISEEEVQYNIYPEFEWINNLPQIEFEPQIVEI
jgi:hypothetical protein